MRQSDLGGTSHHQGRVTESIAYGAKLLVGARGYVVGRKDKDLEVTARSKEDSFTLLSPEVGWAGEQVPRPLEQAAGQRRLRESEIQFRQKAALSFTANVSGLHRVIIPSLLIFFIRFI